MTQFTEIYVQVEFPDNQYYQVELTISLGGLMVGKMVCSATTPGLVDLTSWPV